jgi:two-component system, sensor histidine kinase RegB
MIQAQRDTAIDLQRLLAVRLALLAGIALLAAFAERALALPLPLAAIGLVLAAATAATVGSWLWLKRLGREPGPGAVAAQLAIDMVALTAIVYLSGGWTNPLISLYLVPVAVAAATLSARATWLFAAAALAAYTLLARFHLPVFHIHGNAGDFTVHVAGMWLTFATAAALIAYFGTTMAATVRRQQLALAAARERNLRNEQIIGMATLAAGTAHELSTPLTSIAVIASELEAASRGEVRDELRELLRQVAVCRGALQRLRDAATETPQIRPADELLRDVHDRFALLRPEVRVEFELPDGPAPSLRVEGTFRQALLNLLDNAADASRNDVCLRGEWAADRVRVHILDRGPGLSPDRDTPRGMGVGLLLANASIERLGGQVRAADRPGGGTWLSIELPAHPAGAPA